MNRVGHAFFKRRMRETNAHLRRRGHRPLLLPRQLLRRQRLHPGAADPRADVEEGPEPARAARAAARRSTSSPARSTPSCRAWTRCRRSSTAIAAQVRGRRTVQAGRHLGRVSRLALQRPAVEHRAAAAAESGGDDAGADGSRSATRCWRSSGRRCRARAAVRRSRS